MKVTVQRSMKEKLESFFEYLKARAMHEDHEANRDLIADFVEKVLVFEMKQIENNDKPIDEQIEIPDSVLVAPLSKAWENVSGVFQDQLKKLGADDTSIPDETIPDEIIPDETKPKEKEVPLKQDEDGQSSPLKRNGNGHEAKFKRKLLDIERDTIRNEFINLNGQLADDQKECTRIRDLIGDPITVWQVTGFVSYLHRDIAAGGKTFHQLKDIGAYLNWMKDKRALWEQYTSEKYKNKRATSTHESQPVFAKNFPKGK